MPVNQSRFFVLFALFSTLVSIGTAAPADQGNRAQGGNIVPGDSGERRWSWPDARRFQSMAERAEKLRRAGDCEAFYEARFRMSIALANFEHAIHDTLKVNPSFGLQQRAVHHYYTGYYNQLMGLECPPRAAVAETAPQGAVMEPGTGSGAGAAQENRSPPAADRQRSEKATAPQGNGGAGAEEQARAPWPSKYDPSDLNAKNSETAVEQLEMTNSGVGACVDSKDKAKCDKPEPRRPRPKQRERPESR